MQKEEESIELERVPHNSKKRSGKKKLGRPVSKPRKPKNRTMTLTKKFLDSRPCVQTNQSLEHKRRANKLGMFVVGEAAGREEIEKAIRDCQHSYKSSLVVHQYLIRAFDENITKASIMSFLLYMEDKLGDQSGTFVVKYPEITKFTGAKRLTISKVIKDFRRDGLLSTDLRGIPPKQHYLIDHELLKQLIMERMLIYKDPLLETKAVNIV